MAFFFTLLFLATAYATPTLLFGPLGQYHVVLLFALLAIAASIPGIARSGVLRLPQSYAVLLIGGAVALSTAKVWLSGVPAALEDFFPVMAAFFLTAINVRKPWHLKAIVFAMFLGSVWFITQGAIDLHNNNLLSAYLYTQEAVPRLRGLGVVNDPNDLAQVLVSLIAMVFLWRTRSTILNFVLLGVPIAVLITGMYLTHSRGSSIALMAVVAVTLRRKIGTIPAVVLAGLLLVGVLAAGWGAGRDVSLEGGADRLDAWSIGIGFIEHNPILGVGYHQFAEHNSITAHNSVVVCAAEIGIPAFLVWVLLIFCSFRFSMKLANKDQQTTIDASESNSGLPVGANPAAFWAAQKVVTDATVPTRLTPSTASATPALAADAPRVSAEELRRMALILTIAITGFLTAGWFLSRALSIWLFMYCGMVCALVRMARDNGVEISRDPLPFLLRWSAAIGFSLLVVVYVLLRVRGVVGH